jgi:hypothetical protein
MGHHAVQAVWTMDTQGVDTASRESEFVERIVPSVRAMPRYVNAIHARSADGIRTYDIVVFDRRDGAEAFIRNATRDLSGAIAAGVHLHSIEILDVIVS